MREIATSKTRLIFISHSSSDTWVARQIAREITALGGTPFLDEAEIDAGADFEEDILNSLERAHELVILLTPWASKQLAQNGRGVKRATQRASDFLY